MRIESSKRVEEREDADEDEDEGKEEKEEEKADDEADQKQVLEILDGAGICFTKLIPCSYLRGNKGAIHLYATCLARARLLCH